MNQLWGLKFAIKNQCLWPTVPSKYPDLLFHIYLCWSLHSVAYFIITKRKQNFKYPQPPNVLKRETKISQRCKYADPWHVKAPLAAITASSLLRYDGMLYTSGVGDFLPFLYADPIKLWQVGWATSVAIHFHCSPEMFSEFQVSHCTQGYSQSCS